jgi:hypothetical protein
MSGMRVTPESSTSGKRVRQAKTLGDAVQFAANMPLSGAKWILG